MRPRRSLARQVLSLPNLITYLRIVAIPAVLLVMQADSPKNAFIAALIFAGASATDALDGWLARRFNQTSVIGKLLDPLADKLIVMGTLVMLVDLGRVSAWLVFVILAREMFVTSLRTIAASEGLLISARDLGKQKTAFQMVGIWCLIVHYTYPVLGGSVSFHRVGFWCLLISLGFSLVSAVDYTRAFARRYDGSDASSTPPPPGSAPGAAARGTPAAAVDRGEAFQDVPPPASGQGPPGDASGSTPSVEGASAWEGRG